MADEEIKTDETDKGGEEWDIKRQLRDTTKAFQEKESKYIELLETRDAELQRLTDTVQQFVTSTQAKGRTTSDKRKREAHGAGQGFA